MNAILYTAIGLSLIVILLFVFSKPAKLLARILLNGVIGVFGFIGVNFLLSPFSVSVGVNALTVLIVGILGLPGFVSLYLSILLL